MLVVRGSHTSRRAKRRADRVFKVVDTSLARALQRAQARKAHGLAEARGAARSVAQRRLSRGRGSGYKGWRQDGSGGRRSAMSGDWHLMSALALGAGHRERCHRPAGADRALPRANRGSRRRPRDLPAPYRRTRPRRGRGRPPSCPGGPEAIAARRRADLVEGPLRQRRRRHRPRHACAGGPRRPTRRNGSGARHPRGPGLPRQDQPERVRVLHPRAQSQAGHAAQSFRRHRRPPARRVILGRGRLALARPGRCRHRLGHRRLRARAGCVERSRRSQDELSGCCRWTACSGSAPAWTRWAR